jgi:mono/diheme cytochrome c family protein
MLVSKQLVFVLCLFFSMHTLAYAQLSNAESRGEMLYTTHCNACHSTEIHWRNKKLVTDWGSLVKQVRRWQASIGLNWNNGQIADVARYLNTQYYGFTMPVHESRLQDNKPDPALHHKMR